MNKISPEIPWDQQATPQGSVDRTSSSSMLSGLRVNENRP